MQHTTAQQLWHRTIKCMCCHTMQHVCRPEFAMYAPCHHAMHVYVCVSVAGVEPALAKCWLHPPACETFRPSLYISIVSAVQKGCGCMPILVKLCIHAMQVHWNHSKSSAFKACEHKCRPQLCGVSADASTAHAAAAAVGTPGAAFVTG